MQYSVDQLHYPWFARSTLFPYGSNNIIGYLPPEDQGKRVPAHPSSSREQGAHYFERSTFAELESWDFPESLVNVLATDGRGDLNTVYQLGYPGDMDKFAVSRRVSPSSALYSLRESI